MKLHFKTWLEDAGPTTWVYSNADKPAFDEKIPSKYKARDFKPKDSDDEEFNPDKTFGKRKQMKKRMNKKMKRK